MQLELVIGQVGVASWKVSELRTLPLALPVCLAVSTWLAAKPISALEGSVKKRGGDC